MGAHSFTTKYNTHSNQKQEKTEIISINSCRTGFQPVLGLLVRVVGEYGASKNKQTVGVNGVDPFCLKRPVTY